MGTAADNERIKLKATFFNNLSVGLLLGAGVVPAIGLAVQGNWRGSWQFGLIGFFVGFAGAALRGLADRTIQQLEG